MLLVAGVLAAVVQYLLPTPAPAPVAEAPAVVRPAEPPARPEPPPERPVAPERPLAPERPPAPETAAPPGDAAAPGGPAQMPADALAFPPEPDASATPPVQQGEAEIERAEDTAGPRALAILDLNTASASDLNRLRGGGAIGRAIIAKRPYTAVEQLLSKRVLSRGVYDRIKDQVTVR